MSQRPHERAAESTTSRPTRTRLRPSPMAKKISWSLASSANRAREYSMKVHQFTQELGQKTAQVQGAETPTHKAQ